MAGGGGGSRLVGFHSPFPNVSRLSIGAAWKPHLKLARSCEPSVPLRWHHPWHRQLASCWCHFRGSCVGVRPSLPSDCTEQGSRGKLLQKQRSFRAAFQNKVLVAKKNQVRSRLLPHPQPLLPPGCPEPWFPGPAGELRPRHLQHGAVGPAMSWARRQLLVRLFVSRAALQH